MTIQELPCDDYGCYCPICELNLFACKCSRLEKAKYNLSEKRRELDRAISLLVGDLSRTPRVVYLDLLDWQLDETDTEIIGLN